MAKLACDEAERLKLDKTPEAAEVFASVARSVQAAIAAGTPPTREEMSATTKERLAPLGLSAAWQEWEKTLAAGYLRGEVRTVEQQVKAWEQIAEGLKRCQ
ncbi:MAG: hypothetical protein A3E01_02865 [Gammaproteobacteria bacterium RIFCSPHIGHO2_12_FULL_63_22]|nr:MAG: hypothetical protein A3E01_02865 [Gammaproteobacteria bacterium RIFCSPHIGHO2_12_FULL_63_22]